LAGELPYQVTVISFLNASPTGGVSSGVFGSSLTSVNIPPYASSGAVTLDLSNGETGIHQLPGGVDGQGRAVSLIGLPATGFMSYNIINTQAQPGMLANYGWRIPPSCDDIVLGKCRCVRRRPWHAWSLGHGHALKG